MWWLMIQTLSFFIVVTVFFGFDANASSVGRRLSSSSPLSHAIKTVNPEQFERSLGDRDVNQPVKFGGKTPLALLIEQADTEDMTEQKKNSLQCMLGLFIQKGMDPNSCINNSPAVVWLLLQIGKKGRTASFDLAQQLIQAPGFNSQRTDLFGNTIVGILETHKEAVDNQADVKKLQELQELILGSQQKATRRESI